MGRKKSEKKNLPQSIENFLNKLRVEDGLSLNTSLSYRKDLELFLSFLLPKNIEIETADTDIIKEYLYELNQKKLKPASVARKISCLKSFYNFLRDENFIKFNPAIGLEAPKREHKIPKFLSEEEMLKMLNEINSDKSEFGIKLSCMLEVMYAAGLRVSELVSLPMEAIYDSDEAFKTHLMVKGKGNKERIAPLSKAAVAKLFQYIALRKIFGYGNSKWLFVGKIKASKKEGEADFKKADSNLKQAALSDTHITRQRFHQMLKELAVRVGIDPKKVHPHVIRHSFATHLLNSGVDLRVLQELLGHSDIATTEIYTHILNSKLVDLVFKNHPLSKT